MNQASFSSVGGACLAGNGPLQHLQLLRRAPLDDAFHYVNGLIGCQRVYDLLSIVGDSRLILSFPLGRCALVATPLVMAPNGAAVAILDTIDQCGLHLLAAVGDDWRRR